MRKMRIGLTARAYTNNPESRWLYDIETYFDYVIAGGGLPMMLGTVNEETAAAYAEALDGLVITGGEDVDPAFYGQENTDSAITDHDIDESDILLYRTFMKAGKPVLGICRGIQIINVAEGGSLIQDIRKHDPACNNHNQRSFNPVRPIGTTAHTCTFVPGTELHRIFGDSYAVNTYHHQAVLTPGEGLTVSAVSNDGLIEGIEKDRMTAVQWHPERLAHDPCHLRLMQEFIRHCEESAQ